jgi:voltage-gated potassium channel
MSKTQRYAEIFIQIVIFYSLATYLIELEVCRTEHSLAGHPFFLWSERTVAVIFTAEYLIRWRSSEKKRSYPTSPLAIIDLLAILPFYIGFLVDMRSLRLIRTLRVLRVLKIYRYNVAWRKLVETYKGVRHELYLLGVGASAAIISATSGASGPAMDGPLQRTPIRSLLAVRSSIDCRYQQ